MSTLITTQYKSLITTIQSTLTSGFLAAQRLLEYQRLKTYWEIGRQIQLYAASTGSKAQITEKFYKVICGDIEKGTGVQFTPDTLSRMVYFYNEYPKFPKTTPLTFTHYLALLRVSDAKVRHRLEQKAIKGQWSSGRTKLEITKLNTVLVSVKRTSKALSVERGEPYVYSVYRYTDPTGEKKLYIDCGFKIDIPLNGLVVQSPVTAAFDDTRCVHTVKKDGKYNVYIYKEAVDKLYTYAATVEKVIDADTIDVRIDVGFGIRLYDRLRFRGINAPEMSTAEGKLAKQFLVDYFMNCPKVIVRTYKQKEEMYGRWLADIFVLKGSTDPYQIAAEGEFLNQRLLDEGLAERYK
ncbi:MAG: thermonuclease family protein [Candidatus Omnitrophica bacterium]|nr:thermonuclease family protein [Candidatus Omnitrophota bacterium]